MHPRPGERVFGDGSWMIGMTSVEWRKEGVAERKRSHVEFFYSSVLGFHLRLACSSR